jgi:predicted RNA-binding protein YlxR (DUF448 family)
MLKQRKTPMRMCVACREMRPKKELIRVVRTPQGDILADETGKAAGRGAYLCRRAACLERALKIRAFERALEQKPGPEAITALEAICIGEGEADAGPQ